MVGYGFIVLWIECGGMEMARRKWGGNGVERTYSVACGIEGERRRQLQSIARLEPGGPGIELGGLLALAG
jgi:hypothetical protein